MANNPFALPPLPAHELMELQEMMRRENLNAAVYRRCRLIWELAAGSNLTQAAERAGMHYSNAGVWVKRFLQGGLPQLAGQFRSGRPRTYETEQETLVLQAAISRPKDLGLPFTTWSLVKLEQYLSLESGLAISRKTIRRILQRHGLRFRTGQTWCESDDPDFEAKKTPL